MINWHQEFTDARVGMIWEMYFCVVEMCDGEYLEQADHLVTLYEDAYFGSPLD